MKVRFCSSLSPAGPLRSGAAPSTEPLALMVVTHTLTERNWRLAISHVWQFSHYLYRILCSGNDLSVWSPRTVWSFCKLCNLRNLHFSAHLWTDFQSCYLLIWSWTIINPEPHSIIADHRHHLLNCHSLWQVTQWRWPQRSIYILVPSSDHLPQGLLWTTRSSRGLSPF